MGNNKIHNIDAILPGFPGFYDGIFSDRIKYGYYEDVAKMYFDEINALCDQDLQYQKLHIPKYYNYSTEQIYINVAIKDEDIANLDEEKFNRYARLEQNGSPGYITYCPANKQDFINKFNDPNYQSKDALIWHFLNFNLLDKYGSDIYEQTNWKVFDDIVDCNRWMLEEEFQLYLCGEITLNPQEELKQTDLQIVSFPTIAAANEYIKHQKDNYSPAYLLSVIDCPEEKSTAYLSGKHWANNIGFAVANRDICQDAVDCGLIKSKNCGVWCEFEKDSEINKMYKSVNSSKINNKVSKQSVKESLQPGKSTTKATPIKDAR